MLTLAVFAVGLFAGAALGVFSLIILEFLVCAVTFVDSWSAGFVVACANAMEMSMVLVGAFLLALILSCLSPKFERWSAHWLRRQRGQASDRSLMHGPQ